jgi:hypothetical protein
MNQSLSEQRASFYYVIFAPEVISHVGAKVDDVVGGCTINFADVVARKP